MDIDRGNMVLGEYMGIADTSKMVNEGINLILQGNMGAAPAPHVFFIISTSLLDAFSKTARLEFQGPGLKIKRMIGCLQNHCALFWVGEWARVL